MSKEHLFIATLLFCACSPETKESNDPEEGKFEVVEVYDESSLIDFYDSIQDKWICKHEGTFEEICESHDIDPNDTHLWIFKNIKYENNKKDAVDNTAKEE